MPVSLDPRHLSPLAKKTQARAYCEQSLEIVPDCRPAADQIRTALASLRATKTSK